MCNSDCYAVVTTTIRLRFDGRSTAYKGHGIITAEVEQWRHYLMPYLNLVVDMSSHCNGLNDVFFFIKLSFFPR